MVLKGKRDHWFFLACNLGPVFEKVKIDVRGSLEPFKDLDGRFNPSSTPPSKPTVHVFLAIYVLVFETFITRQLLHWSTDTLLSLIFARL